MQRWIKHISYNDGGRNATGLKPIHNGDCVVRALSILTGNGYMATRNALNEYIKRERGADRSSVDNGVYDRTYKKFLKAIGVTKLHPVDCWTKLPTQGKVMAVTTEHVVAYIDGVINDTLDPVSVRDCGPLVGYYEFDR